MLRVMSASDVANYFNVSRTTIHRLKGRVDETGSVNDKMRSGRPRPTSAVEDRFILPTIVTYADYSSLLVALHVIGTVIMTLAE